MSVSAPHERTTLADEQLLDRAVRQAVDWLNTRQEPEGYWVGHLESNSCMEAQWILAMHFLGVDDDPKYDGVVRAILNRQRPDGSWEVYHDATAGDINATVECYAALRVAGHGPDSPPLEKARAWILEHGGLSGIRVFTRYWLALVGEWPWEHTPTLPPEIIFLPSWCPMNIYRFASWARATLLPIAILSARRPVRELPGSKRLDELFPQGREHFDFRLPRGGRLVSWERFFDTVDRLLRAYVRWPWQPGRENAIGQCLQWIIRHQEADGAWSGIQPPWIYSLMALHTEGYPLDHPVMAAGLKAFDAHWSYQRDGGSYLQASESPVWDTLLGLGAMLDADEDPRRSSSMRAALDWILDQQITTPGDWQVAVPNTPCGGWAFERANALYPDIDDTAVAVVVLARLRLALGGDRRIDAALDRAEGWLLAMQSSCGGWAAFDRDNTSSLVTKIPFCDFGELLDPPSVDVTAHVVEALAHLGRGRDDPAVARALRYIRSEQEPEGSWFGRWGVNHVYGTAAVLPALQAVGEDMTQPCVCRAAAWIVAHQNADGGWGESCASYMDDALRGVGPSTASQTAWALMALLATGGHEYDASIRRGVDYLVSRQKDGTWDEPYYTGTGFPGYGLGRRIDLDRVGNALGQGHELARAFMINYNLYRHYFPLAALGRARKHLGGNDQ